MGVVVDKPRFNVDQVNSATYASKRFSEIRKKAKGQPQFISENNCMDSVVLNYQTYEEMYMELQMLKEIVWEYEIAGRIEKADRTNTRKSLKDVLGDKGYREFRAMDHDSISDEELFE